MSAIAAVLSRGEAVGAPEATGSLVSAMVERMLHRGPDGHGHWTDGRAALGQCQLVTTPEDRDTEQPIRSADGTCVIVADARIDNREEILRVCGAQAGETPPCDAAVILAAYQKWGNRTAGMLLGDFAFAIWDARARVLYCARDQLGVRPLFYHHDARGLRLASEMDALFADPSIPRRPHWLSVALFATVAYSESGQTLYDGISALPPAHYLEATPQRVRIERYWAPDPWRRLESGSLDQHAERLADALREATRCRLRSVRPLAVTVSGGVDSSAVAGLAEQLRREGHGPNAPPTVAHMAYPGLACDEGPFSRAVADMWQLERLCSNPPHRSDLSRPESIAGHRDVYFTPQHYMWREMIEQITARKIRTTLTGLGADVLMRPAFSEWADDLKAGRWGRVARQSGLLQAPTSGQRWRSLWQMGIQPVIPEPFRVAVRPYRSLPRDLQFLTSESQRAVHRWRLRRAAALPSEQRYPDLVTRNLVLGLEDRVFTLALARLDRLIAANGQEYRHPFLDLRVIELLLAVPHEHRHTMGKDKPKPILRRAMQQLLPPAVLHRQDSAEFSCYLQLALLEQHGEAVRRLFANSRLVEAGILRPKSARAIHQDCYTPKLACMINLTAMELWLRQLTS